MQNIILLRALNLTYAKEPKKLGDRILGREEGLLLKDVSFHLYKGEVLGILSDYKTLHYLKEVVNGSLDTKKGKVKTESSVLSLDVLDHVNHPHALSMFATEILDEYLKTEEVEKAVEELQAQALFSRHWKTPVRDLSRRDVALVLLELSKFADAEIIIYCNMYRHLTKDDAAAFKATINEQEKREHGVLLLESNIEPIEILANYFLWLSYGQIRYDGNVKQGIAEYAAYMKNKSQIKNVDEEALFDLEWKRNVSEYGRYAHGLKRLSRNQASPIDRFNIRKIIISLVVLFTMLMASIVIFMDISFTGAASAGQEQTVVIPEEETDDRIAYGISTEGSMEVGGDTYPYMSMLRVSDRSDAGYTVVNGEATEEVDSGSLIYFNPASLYPETTLEDLLPYTDEVFENNYLYYSRFINRDSSTVMDTMSLSASSDMHAELSGIPITYHFREGIIFSMSFPARNLEGMYEAFGVSTENVIFRLPSGYMILDASNETWLYINR
ncbi:hypothetical protein J4760_13090 [Salinicoccus sp. ID82-1]|uniref:Teichoic acid transporter subunit TagH C-terminal domain-containing protein n=1 Tax=Salinicoccus cyprini TaxID=2493691 RepID=A0A558ATM0_9STAP|nr:MULTISPECIES: hypothetical protein [Salinicoccus]MCG1010956.1 hypothetical protein [Salinicoccus sp. ID82-1]TVT27615.1 hypothetical protein FO441_07855 [Salinicoccus cyprini]